MVVHPVHFSFKSTVNFHPEKIEQNEQKAKMRKMRKKRKMRKMSKKCKMRKMSQIFKMSLMSPINLVSFLKLEMRKMSKVTWVRQTKVHHTTSTIYSMVDHSIVSVIWWFYTRAVLIFPCHKKQKEKLFNSSIFRK